MHTFVYTQAIEAPILLADVGDAQKHSGHDVVLVRRQDLRYDVTLAGNVVEVNWDEALGGDEGQLLRLFCHDCEQDLALIDNSTKDPPR